LIDANATVRGNYLLSKKLRFQEKFGNATPICAFPRPDFPRAILRQRGGCAMWVSLFAVTSVIAVALSLAAIAIGSANGGKFRL